MRAKPARQPGSDPARSQGCRLRTAQSGHNRVATAPWTVIDELLAHQTNHYPDKHRAVVNTLSKLRELLPWELERSPEPLDLDRSSTAAQGAHYQGGQQ